MNVGQTLNVNYATMDSDQAPDYYACIIKTYPGITAEDFSLHEDEDGLGLDWFNEATFGPAPSFETLEVQWLSIVKTLAIRDIKELRRQGLDLSAVSSGILAIYMANYEASVNLLEGNGSYTIKNGMTSEVYLTGFGANLGMSAIQFANYIVSENHRVGPSAYAIEKRYLALCYAGEAAAGITPINYLPTVTAVLTAVEDFRAFCGLV
jgi:hypothetical protein